MLGCTSFVCSLGGGGGSFANVVEALLTAIPLVVGCQ